MTLAPAPLQSRFGRRLLLLFVGCAVLPIAIVAAVSYRHVHRELRSQTERRLHQANKALGLAVYERLLLLDATLRSIPPSVLVQLQAAPRPAEATRLLNTGLDLLASRRFVALEFVGDDGRHLPGLRAARPSGRRSPRATAQSLRARPPPDRERCAAPAGRRAPSCSAGSSTGRGPRHARGRR